MNPYRERLTREDIPTSILQSVFEVVRRERNLASSQRWGQLSIGLTIGMGLSRFGLGGRLVVLALIVVTAVFSFVLIERLRRELRRLG